jgi:cyclophilin family peptidyl-prolyl cis-trans isomerase
VLQGGLKDVATGATRKHSHGKIPLEYSLPNKRRCNHGSVLSIITCLYLIKYSLFDSFFPIRNLPGGTVTLARWEDPDCATGEFFINLQDSPHLDKSGDTGWTLGFTVFGEVVSGMEVADALSALPTTMKGGLKMLDSMVDFTMTLSP